MRKEMRYSAIPTIWGGVQYRSKLEARIACFLTSYGYHFDYESLELDRYLPDFVIEMPFGPTLLEVKPAVLATEFKKPCRKITKSGWIGPALVIGSQLCKASDGFSDLTLYGSLAAEDGGWSRVGRGRWPGEWGEYVFGEAVSLNWINAGNEVQWRKPDER